MDNTTIRHSYVILKTLYTLGLVAVFSVIAYFIKSQNDEARLFEEGCKQSEGKLFAPGFRSVSLYKHEQFFEEFENLIEVCIIGDMWAPKDEARYWKAVDKGIFFFSVPVDTKVRFSSSLRQDDSRIKVTVLEGPYKGRSGWIKSDEYGCENWYGSRDVSADSKEKFKQSLISRKLCRYCGVNVSHGAVVHLKESGLKLETNQN